MSLAGTPRDFDFSHVSFVNSQDPSQLADLCGVQLMCLWCENEKCGDVHALEDHILTNHASDCVSLFDHFILRCKLDDVSERERFVAGKNSYRVGHFHCPECDHIFFKRQKLSAHLEGRLRRYQSICERSQLLEAGATRDAQRRVLICCRFCGEYLRRDSIQRHITENCSHNPASTSNRKKLEKQLGIADVINCRFCGLQMAHSKEAEHVATKCRKAPPSLQKFAASEVEVDAEVANVVVGPGTSAIEESPADSETPATNTRSRRAVISPSEGQSCNIYSAENPGSAGEPQSRSVTIPKNFASTESKSNSKAIQPLFHEDLVTVGPAFTPKRARLGLAASDASPSELPSMVHIPVKGPTHLPSGRRRRRPPLWAMLIDEADGVYAVCSEGGRFRTFTHCICIQDAEGNLKAKCEQEKCISMIQSVRAASFAGAGWMCLCRHVMSCINGAVEQAIPCAMDGDALNRIVGIRQITLADATRMLDLTDSYIKAGKHPVVPFFDDAPLIETPYRYMLFSVYDGQHNGLSWCRFGRVAVVYDRIKSRFVCRCPEGKPYGSRAFRKPCTHGILAAWCLETCRPGLLCNGDALPVPQVFGTEFLQMAKSDERIDDFDDKEIREMLEALEGRDGREPGEIV